MTERHFSHRTADPVDHKSRASYGFLIKACPSIVLAAAFVLVGCGPKDPIDRFVRKASSDPYFGNGMWNVVSSTAAASPEQLTLEISKHPFSELGKTSKILEARRVEILGVKDPTNDPAVLERDTFTAILVDTDAGRKVVLLQYVKGGAAKLGEHWMYRFYDQ